MPNCAKLKKVSLNFYKSRHVNEVDSGALTEASCHVPVPVVALCFIDCFKLDHKALLEQESIIKYIILPGVEVPSNFNHQTTRNTLTNIPLHEIQNCFSSPPFFTFQACAVFEETLPPKNCFVDIQVSCRFRDRLGNHFDSTDQSCSFWTYQNGRHMVIFDSRFSLQDGNLYDHVDITFHLTDDISKFSLKGCGIRLPHDSTPSPGNSNIVLEDITEADDGGYETESNDLETRITLVMESLSRLTCCGKRRLSDERTPLLKISLKQRSRSNKST